MSLKLTPSLLRAGPLWIYRLRRTATFSASGLSERSSGDFSDEPLSAKLTAWKMIGPMISRFSTSRASISGVIVSSSWGDMKPPWK